MDALSVLARNPVFDGVDPGDLQSLALEGRIRTYARGTFLFQEGAPAGPLFIVLSGTVKIQSLGHAGDESVFALLGPDELLGDITLFDADPERSADAQALEPTQCLVLPRAAVERVLERNPAAMRRLVVRLAERIRHKDQAFAEVAYLDIPGRVAAKLLELVAAHGRPETDGTRIDLHLSQRSLAGMVGASRENVNRSLAAFTAQGVIRQEGGMIVVLSCAALQRRC